MAISERLAYILDFDVRSGVKSLEKVGSTADKELKKVEDRTDKAAANLTKFGVGALAIAGSAGVGLAKMAQGAAETDANLSALNQVLGDTVALNIEKWAEDGATAVGLSERAIYSAATSFGQLGKVAGLAGSELEEFTKRQVTLAADMAAFKDVSPEQAIQDLTAAYAGSSETLQKYNVFVNDTNIKAAIQKETGEKVTGTLTSQQRVMGINLLLMEQTVDIQGQWSRESGGLAGQMATAKAELTNLSDEIGAAAIPVMVQMLGVVRDGIGAFNSLNDATGGNLGTIAVWGVAIAGAIGGVSALAGQVIKARDSIKTFATEMTTAKASVIGVTTVVAVGILAYQQYAKRKQEATARTNEFVTALGGEADAQNEAIDALIAGKFANETYADALETAGLTIADIVRVARGETVPAFEKLTDTLDDGGTALFRLTEGSAATESELRALVRAAEAERSALGNARTETERKSTATDELGRATAMYTEFAAGMRGELEAGAPVLATYDDRVEGVARAMDDAASATERERDQAKKNIETTERLTDEYNDQKSAIDGVLRAKTLLVGGEIAVRQSQREAKTAMDELNQSIADGTLAYEDLGPALDEVVTEQMNAAQAAATYQADQLRANGSTVDAQTEMFLYKQELQKLADQATGPTRDALLALIAQLDEVARDRTATVNIEVLQNGQRVNLGGGSAIGGGIIQDGPDTGARATGASVASGASFSGGGGTAKELVAPVTNIYNAVSVNAIDAGTFMYDLDRMAKGLG